MTVRVERVENDEQYQRALAIRTEVFVVEQKVPIEIEVDEYESICDHFLCIKDGEAVATGRLRKKEAIIKFERIATLAKHRGNNYGFALMLAMQEQAARKYPGLLPYMHAQTSATGFYQKLGWTKIGGLFLEADIEHYAMSMLLAGGITGAQRDRLTAMDDLPAPLRTFLG